MIKQFRRSFLFMNDDPFVATIFATVDVSLAFIRKWNLMKNIYRKIWINESLDDFNNRKEFNFSFLLTCGFSFSFFILFRFFFFHFFKKI